MIADPDSRIAVGIKLGERPNRRHGMRRQHAVQVKVHVAGRIVQGRDDIHKLSRRNRRTDRSAARLAADAEVDLAAGVRPQLERIESAAVVSAEQNHAQSAGGERVDTHPALDRHRAGELQTRIVGDQHAVIHSVERECLADVPRCVAGSADQHAVVRADVVESVAFGRPVTDDASARRVVVADDPLSARVRNEGARRVRQFDRERFDRLDLGVADDRDADRPRRLTGQERHRSADGHVVRTGGRGPVDGGEVNARRPGSVAAASHGKDHRRGAAVPFDQFGVVDRQAGLRHGRLAGDLNVVQVPVIAPAAHRRVEPDMQRLAQIGDVERVVVVLVVVLAVDERLQRGPVHAVTADLHMSKVGILK